MFYIFASVCLPIAVSVLGCSLYLLACACLCSSVMLFNMFLSACFLLVSAGWFVFVLLEFSMW